MTKKPYIAHSEVTNEIYIVCGAEKYPVTEQVIKAMQNTGRLEQQPSDDCVSRKDVLEMFGYETAIYDLPPVTPTHGICKDCNLWCRDRAIDGACFCSSFHTYTGYEFYCADYEKRGNSVVAIKD